MSAEAKMMRRIRIQELESVRKRLASAIDRHVELVERYRAYGCADSYFQRLFTGFFRVRRDVKWRSEYFKLFKKYERGNDGLFLLLWDLFSATGNVEASFATKMLALIDPSRPIWDRYVLVNLGIKAPPPYLDHGIRIGLICDKMDTITRAYERLSKRPDMVAAIDWVDVNFPKSRTLTKMKKMDFVLWAMR